MLMVKGERHAATTFIQSLLERTFPEPDRVRRIVGWHHHDGCRAEDQPSIRAPDDLLICCSKHGAVDTRCTYYLPRPPIYVSEPIYVLVLRSPYSWLSANFFVPFGGCEQQHNFSAWLRSSWTTYGMCKPWRVRATPVAVWSEHALSYVRWAARADRTSILIRDHDVFSEQRLLSSLQSIGALLGQRLGLSAEVNADYFLPKRMPPIRRGLSPWTSESYTLEARKHRAQPWRRLYREDDLLWVNALLPDEAMAGFDRVRSGCIECAGGDGACACRSDGGEGACCLARGDLSDALSRGNKHFNQI